LSGCDSGNKGELNDAGVNGSPGEDGTDGISVIWQGVFYSHPENPEVNWAYYNSPDGKAYIWDGDSWEVLAANGQNGANGTSIAWQGTLASAPASPQTNWAYYNSADGKAYIWDGDSWEVLAANGQNGISGNDGISISWLGSSATAPVTCGLANKNKAYYDSTEKKSYICDGSAWQILAQDGAPLTTDTTVPVAGTKDIFIKEIFDSSITLSWTAAIDETSNIFEMNYSIVYSTSNNISTLQDAINNGTVGYSGSTLRGTVGGLTNYQTYFFNVIAADGAGNKVAYTAMGDVSTNIYGLLDNKDGTIRDTHTNLVWMKCSQGQVWNPANNDCTLAGNAGNNYGIASYQYCPTADSSCDNGIVLTSGPAYNTCNDLSFDGKTDWRVPVYTELTNLVYCGYGPVAPLYIGTQCNTGSAYPTIAQSIFPNTMSNYYWSSTPYTTTNAWSVYFNTGRAYENNKADNYYVRCVSPGP
jgi:hypothetical protein